MQPRWPGAASIPSVAGPLLVVERSCAARRPSCTPSRDRDRPDVTVDGPSASNEVVGRGAGFGSRLVTTRRVAGRLTLLAWALGRDVACSPRSSAIVVARVVGGAPSAGHRRDAPLTRRRLTWNLSILLRRHPSSSASKRGTSRRWALASVGVGRLVRCDSRRRTADRDSMTPRAREPHGVFHVKHA